MTEEIIETIDMKRDRLVIFASSLGTMFEWYDFFVYATIAPIIAKLFFPTGSEIASMLLALATFGVGFGITVTVHLNIPNSKRCAFGNNLFNFQSSVGFRLHISEDFLQ